MGQHTPKPPSCLVVLVPVAMLVGIALWRLKG